ncbi:hypothetical protein [Streptomyces sp. NPDC093109]|uniref:hypothetical protein n=1 Tax=Streptomyces sp. NPDC093109 TaxID=3154977 RepID=UPI00344DD246
MKPITYFPGRGTFREEAYLEGKVEGQVEERTAFILRVLELRLGPVSEDVRERVNGCSDPDTLSRWLDRAIVVAEVEDVFSDGDVETGATGAGA